MHIFMTAPIIALEYKVNLGCPLVVPNASFSTVKFGL
jgi:hypothetical protein